jgi:cobalt-zinc-cadmium efflux system protein
MLFTPEDIQIDDIVKGIQEIDVIKNVHHVHVWQLNENEIHLEAHIDFTEDISLSKFNKILYQIEKNYIIHTE